MYLLQRLAARFLQYFKKNTYVFMKIITKLFKISKNDEKATLSQPVNYSTSILESKTGDQISEDIDYAIKIADSYLSDLKNNNLDISGKDVLELGPGINFGSAIILLWNGAKTVTVMDKYISKFTPSYHGQFYENLLKKYSQIHYNENKNTYIDYNLAVSSSKLNILEISLEDSGHVEFRFDYVFSCAVLEHLNNPPIAINNLYNLMKDKSFGSHQIDFRDHRDFSKPLEYLKLEELEFLHLFESVHGECGNRLRSNQWIDLFNRYFLNNISFSPNMFAEKDYLNSLIIELNTNSVSNYSHFQPEILRVISGKILHSNF